MMQNTVFSITKETIDECQKNKKYWEAANYYLNSTFDEENPDIRLTKLGLYTVLAGYSMYDPVQELPLSSINYGLPTAPFEQLPKIDPDYSDKMIATLLVLYYCIKNRSFNYAIKHNANHDEITQTEALREYLENHAEEIINCDSRIEKMLAAVMVLLYDKMLSAKVELFHEGKDVIDSITFDLSGVFSPMISRRNTSTFQTVGAMRLKCIEEYRPKYVEARKYWNKKIRKTDLGQCKNTFLYGTYDLKEINRFLKKYNFKLYNIQTKYYENFFAESAVLRPIRKVIEVFHIITDNEQNERRLKETNKRWSVGEMIKSAVLTSLKSIPFAILAALPIALLGKTGVIISIPFILLALLPFFAPYNRFKERRKRETYSLIELIKK